MVCLNRERFRLPATIAALSAIAVAPLISSAPASAHAYHHYRYSARREAAPTVAGNFAPTPYQDSSSPIDGMAASAASAAGIPVSLVERVIIAHELLPLAPDALARRRILEVIADLGEAGVDVLVPGAVISLAQHLRQSGRSMSEVKSAGENHHPRAV